MGGKSWWWLNVSEPVINIALIKECLDAIWENASPGRLPNGWLELISDEIDDELPPYERLMAILAAEEHALRLP